MGFLRKLIKTIKKAKKKIAPKHTSKKRKGKVGEKKVDNKLNPLIFGKVEHRQINNIILVDEKGKSHQIDHIEIRENGIFCIETKNYKGLILGGENQDKWTQCLYGKEKCQFTNPLKQNKTHIYHISQVLGKEYIINSVVVMVQNNASKIDCSNVINLDDLNDYLKNFNDGTHYSIEEMDMIYNKLINAQTEMSNKEHVKNIKQTQKELKQGICPRCGAQLVEREGQYGKFYGCSAYPKCKFIMKNK